MILSNPTGGAALGALTNVPVNITDNDLGIGFQFGTYSVPEDAGVILLGVVRGDNGTNAVSVNVATTDLTAASGLDYTSTTNTLVFGPQERFKVRSYLDPQQHRQAGKSKLSRDVEQSHRRLVGQSKSSHRYEHG